MSHILVTGATGFLGKTIVPTLLRAGHRLTLLVKEEYSMGKPLPVSLDRQAVSLQYADLRNLPQVRRAVVDSGAARVVHLAAVGTAAPFLKIDTALRHNLSGTLNLLKACFETAGSEVEQLVVARTPGETLAMNPYSASKAAAWEVCKMYANAFRWPIIGAMVFQAYGAYQQETSLIPSAIRAALNDDDFPMTAGTQKRDWVHVQDVAEAFKLAVSQKDILAGTTLEIGSGQSIAVRDIVQYIYTLSQSEGNPLFDALPTRRGEVPEQVADITICERELEWFPSTAIEDGLRQLIAESRMVQKSYQIRSDS